MKIKDLPSMTSADFYAALTEHLRHFTALQTPGDSTYKGIDWDSSRPPEADAVLTAEWASPDGSVLVKFKFELDVINARVFTASSNLTIVKPVDGVLPATYFNHYSEAFLFYVDELQQVVQTWTRAAEVVTSENYKFYENKNHSNAAMVHLNEISMAHEVRPIIRKVRPEDVVLDPGIELCALSECGIGQMIACTYPFVQLSTPHPRHPAEMPGATYKQKIEEARKVLSVSGWDELRESEYDRNVMRWKAQAFSIVTVALDDTGGKEEDLMHRTKLTQDDIANIMKGRLDKFTIEKLLQVLLRLGYNYDLAFRPVR